MIRRATLAVSATALLVVAFGRAPQTSAPIRLARQPDYHAGKIAFSYLGDIWTANEDGSTPLRLTDHRGHDMYPRFSPDGKWIAFSSNRYGNNDVFVIPAAGGAPRRLTFHTGSDEVVGWSRDSQRVLFRAAHGDGAFPNVATLYEVAVGGGPEQALPVDWGYYGSFSPDGKSLVFNRHPAVWTRQHYRGSFAADLWIADLGAKTYTKLLPDERYNRYWPMWGADNAIYFVGDPLSNDRSVAPGSADVRRSANNIYKIPAGGGQPVQVTRHVDGNLFWPSMSSDGKVIVYEELFGIWKLDVATGKTNEIRIEIAADEKDNETDVEAVKDVVDSFDLSPSGRRAVISAKGQILTIATERGDITRVVPDDMASRNQFPRWSPDGKYLAFVSDRSGRDEIWVSDPDGKSPKKITDADNEKGAVVWSPDSKSLLYTAADKKLYNYTVADGKTTTVSSSDVNRIGSVSVSPDSKWVALAKQDRTLRSHVYIVPMTGGEERHVSDDRVLYSEANAVWTADGRYLVFTSSEGFSNGIATQGGINTTMSLWVQSLRDRDRDPMNRDIDNEAQGLAAEAAARQGARGSTGGGQAGAGPAVPRRRPTCGSTGTACRGARAASRCQAHQSRASPPAPEGHVVALTVSSPCAGGRGAAPRARRHRRRHVPRRGRNRTADARAGRTPAARWPAAAARGGGGAFGGAFTGPTFAFARDGRTLFFRVGRQAVRGTDQSGAGDQRPGDRRGRRRRPRRPRRRRWSRCRTGGRARAGHGGGRCGDRAAGHLHRHARSRSQGAARAGVQRGLAHHEEPVLRREDARRELERGARDVRAAARAHRRRGRSAHDDDDDDRAPQRVAHRRERRPEPDALRRADALSGIRSRRRSVRLFTRSATSTRTGPPITTT